MSEPRALVALAIAGLLAASPAPTPAQTLAGRTLILSETIAGGRSAPLYVTLAAGTVYRLELVPTGMPGGELGLARVQNAHWLLDAEVTPQVAVTVTPRVDGRPPAQILLPLDRGSVGDPAGLSLLLRPVASGEYRLDAQAFGSATLLLRVVRQDADNVEWACVAEHDAGQPAAACGELHAARRALNPFGRLTLPVTVAAFVLVVSLLGH